jgi:hypothetical protein
MTLFYLDPCDDPRWPDYLRRHPRASAFHTPAWAEAIRDTYGYESVVLTATPPDEPLAGGLIACNVRSWITGSRMVAMPFADHCDLLVDSPHQRDGLLAALAAEVAAGRRKYVELRPLHPLLMDADAGSAFHQSASYSFHALDLRPGLDQVYRGFHKSCVQRKIERAGRESLAVDCGRSEELLQHFYGLLLLTRRRHQIPPQPISWFRSLIRRFEDDLLIWIAFKDNRPIAGIVTIAFRNTVIYKYGCSDSGYHSLGGMPTLFWHAIRYASERGAEVFDMGRSDADNRGLISFKEHWGAATSSIAYYQCRNSAPAHGPESSAGRIGRFIFPLLPDRWLTAAGRLLYRHIA